jgi:hypothetical protein
MSTPQLATRPSPRLVPQFMSRLDTPEEPSKLHWLWHGLIARGNVTLFTSLWKTGKTTLLTGLLQQFAAGGTFIGQAVSPARALVVSEERRATWADRVERMPIGDHCRLLPRPFPRRPTPDEWDDLIDVAVEMQKTGHLDILVIDPLAKFLPGKTDTDLNTLQTMLDPLQRLTDAGAGVVLLHHPRKKPAEEGSSARGHGGLLGLVDIIVELRKFGRLRSDSRKRKLFAMSRFPETPEQLVYEWDAEGRFVFMGNPLETRFQENWDVLRSLLAKRKQAVTHQELLMDWPAELTRPSPAALYEWLNRAYDQKLVRRKGVGQKADPYRYRLPNADDVYYDRGELPPIKKLGPLFGR